jgi:hypothetical protein
MKTWGVSTYPYSPRRSKARRRFAPIKACGVKPSDSYPIRLGGSASALYQLWAMISRADVISVSPKPQCPVLWSRRVGSP